MNMNKGRNISGAKYHSNRKKKKFEKQHDERKAVLGERRTKVIRGKGGHKKTVLLRANTANLIIGKKSEKVEITNVIETPQNRFLARQNRLAKGAIIQTSKGKAKITNRPSQEGNINAVLIKE